MTFNRRNVVMVGTIVLLAGCKVIPKGTPTPAPPPEDRPTDALPADQMRHRVALLVPMNGPNADVGQSLAKMEVLTLLAKILGSFTIELAPEMGGLEGVLARESTQLTLQTKGTKGIRMRMTPRSEHVAAGVVCAGAVSE